MNDAITQAVIKIAANTDANYVEVINALIGVSFSEEEAGEVRRNVETVMDEASQ